MKLLARIVVWVGIVFGFVSSAIGQAEQSWQKLSGLTTDVVYGVFQDSKGFLWVGTDDGVFRYDGYGFKQFTIREGLVDNDVFNIKEDRQGRIWLLTNKGWPCYYESGQFFHPGNTAWLSSVRPQRIAIHYSELPNGDIWYACLDTAYRIHGSQVVERLVVPGIADKVTNIQYLIEWNGQLLVLHNQGVYNHSTKRHHLFDKEINSVHIKVYRRGNCLFYFDFTSLYCMSLSTYQSKLVASVNRDAPFVCFLNQPGEDTIRISTATGEYWLNEQPYPTLVSGPRFKGLEFVSDLITDREGNRWVSSITHGLHMNRREPMRRTQFAHRFREVQGKSCWSISKAATGVFIGLASGGAFFPNAEANEPSRFYKIPRTDSRLKVFQVIDVEGHVWMVSGNEAIVYNKLNNQLVPIGYSIKEIGVSEKELYLATSTGLAVTEKVIHRGMAKIPNIISRGRISRVCVATNDSVWAGGILGLRLLVDKQSIPLTWSSSLVQGNVSDIIRCRNKDVLFSTTDQGIGLIRGNRLYEIKGPTNKKADASYHLAEDQYGGIWVLTNTGVQRFFYQVLGESVSTSWFDYSKSIDLIGRRINDIQPIGDSLYLATDIGVLAHALTDQRINPEKPLLQIEHMEVGDTCFHLPPAQSLLPNQNNIRFRYVGLHLASMGNIRYRYRLEPLDTTWQYTNSREVIFPFLNAGQYRFVLDASLPDGEWTNKPLYWSFTIATPFYRTLSFFLLVGFLALLILATIVYLRITNIRTRHQLQQETLLFEKRLAELEHQALRLQMNPHFIFNAINAIQGFYASGDKVAAKEYTTQLASLVRMIFESGRKHSISLEAELNLLRAYVGLFQVRMEHPLRFDLQVDSKLNLKEIQVPPMLIQPIVENALQYGLAPLRQDATLTLRFVKEDQIMRVEVIDNGVGRRKSVAMQGGIPKVSSGIDITQQRLELLYKERPKLPSMEIDDANPSLENPGTIVLLRIPL